MPDTTNAQTERAPQAKHVEYVTRFVDTGESKNAKVLLPYVQDALRTLGYGSAVVVGDAGIQLTVPVQLMHFLESTIKSYVEKKIIEEFSELDFYPPAIRFSGATASPKELVDSLGICPPDMRIEWMGLADGGALVVSGPPDPDRHKHYIDKVLPRLKALAAQLNPSFAIPPH